VLLLILFGPHVAGQWCRNRAARDLDTWALTAAQEWLRHAEWLDPRDATTALMNAQVYRQLRDERPCDAGLQLAEKLGAARGVVARERTLGQIQAGELDDQASNQFQVLVESGASSQDVSACFISGALARDDQVLAKELLDAWERDLPDHPQVVFLRGALEAIGGDRAKARVAFERVLTLEPRHDLARLALAQTEEADNHVAAALAWYRPLVAAHPQNELIATGYARCLRKSGRLAEAKAVLESLPAPAEVGSDADIEMISIDLERGDFQAAQTRLKRVEPSRIADDDALTMAGITASMLGDTTVSEHLILSKFNRQAAKSLVEDLQTRATMYPFDGAVASQLQLAGQQWVRQSSPDELYNATWSDENAAGQNDISAKTLYARHCESCHGVEGYGDGVAARHVFPRPRDLRREPMRLVSTDNGVPSRQDLLTVIDKGIPGTSMVPIQALSGQQQQLKLLADEALRMRREGVREQYLAQFAADDLPDEEDVNETVALRTNPGVSIALPELQQPDSTALELGKRLYTEQACLSCHGESGTGDQLMPLFDVVGSPCFPRDLVHDLYKGGNDLPGIYLRILLGMPGTPHPATVNLTSVQVAALTHYCHSLAKEPKQTRTNHQRAVQAWRRPAVQWAESTPQDR
jgi:mono/diheme cytochrome c family protein/Flp pilus assembly protein TadD